MPERVASNSLLAGFAHAENSSPSGQVPLSFAERRSLGQLNLRGDLQDVRFATAVADMLGVRPPSTANTFAEKEGTTICWLGPDEWLVVMARERTSDAVRVLQGAFAGLFASVTDVSGGHTVIALRGQDARTVLEKGCPLDLDPRAFGPGRCAQSHVAKAPVLIRQTDDVPTFEVVVRRALADYLWTWLGDATAGH